MKRFTALFLGLVLCFAVVGCGATPPCDLSGTTEIEIHAYDNDSSEPFAKVIINGKEDVAAIIANFSALSLKKMDYVEPSVAGYDLYFRDASDNQLAQLCLPYGPDPWVVCGGDAYAVQEGSVDVDFLAQLVETAVSSGAEQQDELSDIAEPILSVLKLKDLVRREGENLTWEDFASYYSEDIGSGMYILRYPIAEAECYLLIGGESLELPPMYIRLVLEADQERYIDVRYESIDDFLASIGYEATVGSGLITKVVPNSVPAEASDGFSIPVPDEWVNRDSTFHKSTPDTDVDPDFSIPHNGESVDNIVSVPIPDAKSSDEDRQTIVPIAPETDE